MSLNGFNRSALNGGVSGIIAGAALVIAVSGFAADGTRVVLPSAEAIAVSTAQSTAVRTAYGDGGFVVISSGSAWPALLQLQSADIVVVTTLSATYTDVWGYALGGLTGSGFITRPGAGVSAGISTVSATPLVTAGFASNINAVSTTTADASVTLNGQSTVQRDGYVQQMDVSSTTTANALRTALGYATSETTSSCTTDSIKTHGGQARMDGVFSVSAIASTDAAYAVSTSSLTADAQLTQSGEASSTVLSVVTVQPTLTTFAVQVDLSGVAAVTANARTALLGLSDIVSTSEATAAGEIYKPGAAIATATSELTAQWGILISSSAGITALSTVTAFASTNAEAPDPAERTMYRIATDRTMYRPFTDREMRRSA